MLAFGFKAVIRIVHLGALIPIHAESFSARTSIELIQFFPVIKRVCRRRHRGDSVVTAIVIILDVASFILVHCERTKANPRFHIFILRNNSTEVICLERADKSRAVPASIIAISRTRPRNIVKLKVLIRKLETGMSMVDIIQQKVRSKQFIQIKRVSR